MEKGGGGGVLESVSCKMKHNHIIMNFCLRSNVNTLFKSAYRTAYMMIVVMFVLSATITRYEIFAIEICVTLTLTIRMGRRSILMVIE